MKQRFQRFILGWTLVVLLGAVFSSPVLAQDPIPTPSDDEINAIAKRMYCPVCENIPLDVCATEACEQWREMIGEKLTEGWTEDEIFDYFVKLYGDRVLAEPPRTGINWLIYILPPLLVAVGVYVIVRGFRMWNKPVDSLVTDAAEVLDSDYISQMEEELKKRN